MNELDRVATLQWDDSEAAWMERMKFVRSILEWPRYRRLQAADKGEVVSRVMERAHRFTRTHVPRIERGFLTQLTKWEAARELARVQDREEREPLLETIEEGTPPEEGRRLGIGSAGFDEGEDEDDRSEFEKVLDLLTVEEIRFFFLEFFRRYAPACLEPAIVKMSEGQSFKGLAGVQEIRPNTLAARWKRCRKRVEDYVTKTGLPGILRIVRGEEPA